jgi:histidinol-phosphatase
VSASSSNPDVPPAPVALLDECVELAREAGRLTLRYFRAAELVVERKGDGSPVTDADRGAEALIRAHLRTHHPDATVVGEEEGVTTGDGALRFVIDPIDGTKAFTHGVPLYSNLLAVEDEYGPAIGVINLPALGETVYAGRGLGCFCDGVPARVTERTELDGGYLTTSGYDYWPEEAVGAAHRTGMRMRTWGDGYGYALVATGRVDAMVDWDAAEWDLAPMPVILSEAGGRFSDRAGRTGATGGSGVATNGHLHEAILQAITTAG